MERCFIATKDSKYFKDYKEYIEKAKIQGYFVKEFFDENGIEGSKYIVGGDGCVNCSFDEDEKSKIGLSIESTENNLNKFGKILCKLDQYNLCQFKKNSKISKEFAQQCVDKKIIINVYKPYIGDYFANLAYMRYSYQQFYSDEEYYIKIESEYLKEDDTPEGFKEIKLSEFYKIKEGYIDNKNN